MIQLSITELNIYTTIDDQHAGTVMNTYGDRQGQFKARVINRMLEYRN